MTTATTTLTRRQKWTCAFPFAIVCILAIYCWIEILAGSYAATWRQEVALIAIASNLVLYFFRFKLAILLTVLILVCGTFNLLSFF